MFYLVRDGRLLATAAGIERPQFSGEGCLHMVCSSPEARGLGLGRAAVLAVLNSFAAGGYKSVVLSTDDFRIPAIATYLKLGFKPIFLDDTHEERWEKVIAQIKNKRHKGADCIFRRSIRSFL